MLAAVLAAVELLILLCMLAFEDVRERLVADRRRPGTLGPDGARPERRVTGVSPAVTAARSILTLINKRHTPCFGSVLADILHVNKMLVHN